jgi:ubiquinone/menaquinone biosynthesis C-methylase UbiE
MVEYFNQKASTWDINPVHYERSVAVYKAINEKLSLNKDMIGLEYGAGTGMLSFLLKDDLNKIILMDYSSEMLKIDQQKIVEGKISNLYPVLCNLEKEDYHTLPFDLIFSQMVFHHIGDIEKLVNKLFMLLKEEGNLVIVDLYREDGSFHGKDFGGHNGFDPGDLKMILENAGFKMVNYEPCYVIKKEQDDGIHEYPIFIMIGEK